MEGKGAKSLYNVYRERGESGASSVRLVLCGGRARPRAPCRVDAGVFGLTGLLVGESLAEGLGDDAPAEQRGDRRGAADERHAHSWPSVAAERRRDDGSDARRCRAEAERGGAHGGRE
eukprot:scaffold1805_cov63-Phaeocystis_antarctica.AAC.1